MIKLKHTTQSTCRATSQLAPQNLAKVVRHIELLTFNQGTESAKLEPGGMNCHMWLCLHDFTNTTTEVGQRTMFP